MHRFVAILLGLAVTFLSGLSSPVIAASETNVRYLVVSLKQGRATVLQSKLVRSSAPLRSLSASEVPLLLSHRRRDRQAYRVSVRDRSQRIVHQTVVEGTPWIRGEFHGKRNLLGRAEIEGHLHELDSTLIVLRIPETPGGSVALDGGGSQRSGSITIDLINKRSARTDADAVAQLLPDWANGDPANRVDLVILGDGYVASEREKFEADTKNLLNSFFSITPYREYRNYVNVWMLFVASEESGADQPAYDARCADYGMTQSCCRDTGAMDRPSRFVDTAFDATYCSYDTQRLLTVNMEKVLAAAANAPAWDKLFVLVNDATYGGSGGAVGVASTNALAVEVAQHEYGHSFTNLADEYEMAYPGYPTCSDTWGLVPCEANVTDQSDSQAVKWQRWLAQAPPGLSLLQPQRETEAGLWEGARFQSQGMFRQGYYCLMRALGTPFCDVASEAYAVQLYQGEWGVPIEGIDNIEPGSENPAPGSVVTGESPWLQATVLGPADGPPLKITWLVDGVSVATSTAGSGATVSYQLQRPQGTYAVRLEVADTSPILHPLTQLAVASSRAWTITTSACGNAAVEADEQCDDGNADGGDGCSASCRAEACFACDGSPSSCSAVASCRGGDNCCPESCNSTEDSDCPILVSGKSLVVKDHTESRRRKLVFQLRDPQIDVSTDKGANPMFHGATLQLYSESTGQSVCVPLPAQHWTSKGSTFSYRDTSYLSGPCKSAKAEAGLFRMTCNGQVKDLDYGLSLSKPRSLTAILQTGSARYCTVFGGSVSATAYTDPETGVTRGEFKAKSAPVPPTCPQPRERCP